MITDMTANTINASIDSEFSLLRQIPYVLRARGFRLYLADGRRLVDLWLNGGAAVMGHTPANLLREIKNTAGRGLYAPLPHFSESRFLKALSVLFPGRFFRLYAAPPDETADFFISGKAKLWRPFVDPANPFAADNTPLLVPVLPGIQTWRDNWPMGLCVTAVKSEDVLKHLPQSDSLSPVLLSAAARGIYDIIAAKERVKINYPRIMRALKNSIWKKQGIYLTLKKEINNDEWTALFHRFLDAGFLLPPIQTHPLILPGELSDGEEVNLAKTINEDK
ncbi:MAG: hypothetical protein FWC22_08355 [Treponema sp.]|nr:hypothetical protein [Treponema sp.]